VRNSRGVLMANSANDRRIDYIEMGVGNIERSKAFYGQAFGWTFKDYGPAYCEFADGRLTGGFTTDSTPRPVWLIRSTRTRTVLSIQSRCRRTARF